MIRSMTGFASLTFQNNDYIIETSIKSVNSRYLEVSVKIPEQIKMYEIEIRNSFRDYFDRGKFEINISIQDIHPENNIKFNESLVKALINHAKTINQSYAALDPNAKTVFDAGDILLFPQVIISESASSDLQNIIKNSVKTCMERLNESREQEGSKIEVFLRKHLDEIEKYRKTIEQNMPEIVEWQKQKVQNFISQHQVKVDASLLEQEVILLCQRMDIAEELNRLTSHIAQAYHILDKGGVCGKRLDFLMQEFNRETNTIASKSINTEITASAIELKVQIEQMSFEVTGLF